MRILFTTQPAYGHFRPLLPLANALRSRGHEVRVATSGLFGPVVGAHGLPAVPAGLEWLESDKSTIPDDMQAPPNSTIETFFAHQFVRMTASRLAEDVIAHATEWAPAAIVRESTEFGGALAAEALRIPTAAVQVASPSLVTPAVLAAVASVLEGVRTSLGLPPDPHLTRLQAAPVLCFAPLALHDPTVPLPPNFVSFRPEPWRDEAVLPVQLQGLGSDRPLVYATLGTVFNNPDYELPFFPAILESLGGEDVDVLVALGPGADPAALGSQPANIHVADYIPQRAVLEQSSVVVCHGGYGTLLDAVDSAVPLIVVPFGADQHINGASVARLGIGRVIDEVALTADVLRGEVHTLLEDPESRRNITGLREAWHALPGPAAAAALVEQLGEPGRQDDLRAMESWEVDGARTAGGPSANSPA